MTTRPTPAERLLSMLEDEEAIAGLPAEEVRRELDAFALDPGASVAFAKALAHGDSPGRRLIGALSAGDEEDDISRLESADIDEVRAQVDRGTAAAVAAEARRRAGSPGNVVGLAENRRRRRRLIVWGGPLAGIAASFLVFAVIFGNAYLDRSGETSRGITAGKPDAPADSMSDAYVPPAAKPDQDGAGERRARSAEPEAGMALPSKEKGLAEAEPVPPAAEKKSAPSANEAETLEKQERFAAAPEGPPLPLPSEAPPAMPRAEADGDAVQGRENFDSALNGLEPSERPAAAPPLPESTPGLARSVEISELDAVLVVDPSQVPLLVQSQSQPASDLRRRLDDARRLAGDRQVIALYRVRTGDRRRDYAQVPLQPGLSQQLAAPAPLIGLLGVEAGRYDFIPLPGAKPAK